MARKSDSRLTPAIKGELRLRNTPIRRRSDSARLRSLQSGRSVSDCLGSIRLGRRLCARSSLRHWLANSYRSHNQRGTGPRLDRSGSGPVIVVQHAAQALPTLDLSRASEVAGFGSPAVWPYSLCPYYSQRNAFGESAVQIVNTTTNAASLSRRPSRKTPA